MSQRITGFETTGYDMTEVINLRMARKRAVRKKTERSSDENRLTHGVTKVQRQRATADREQHQKILDQHKIETGGRP